MLKREYTCPKCSKTVSFLPLARKRACPHCGRDVMDWDLKQDGAKAGIFTWQMIALALLGIAAIVGSFVYFNR